jgi:hypothetical protein
MDDTTKKLIYDAQLIINLHHDGVGENVMMEGYDIRQRAMVMAGYTSLTHTEDTWDSYIPKLPKEIRATMIELDDSLSCHDTTRYS